MTDVDYQNFQTMSKDKSEVPLNGKPSFYACLYSDFRQVAIENGYALAIHGSMQSDMDLLAVAWTEEAIPHEELVELLFNKISATIWKEHTFKDVTIKPHGRLAYTLHILGDWFIDLSIIPPNR